MPATSQRLYEDAHLSPAPAVHRLDGLAKLACADIETPFVADLSDDLHALFDPVCDAVLPIYFGPLLGRLYLEGL